MGKNKTNKTTPSRSHVQSRSSIGGLYIESPVPRLAAVTILAVLIWMALRLWWSFLPVWLLPSIIGLLLSILLKKPELPIVSLIISVLAAILFPLQGLPVVMVIIISVAVMTGVSILASSYADDHWREIIPYLVLAVILMGFFFHAFSAQHTINEKGYSFSDVLRHNPIPESYGFDGFTYIRTFYLMEEGRGYYGALNEAIIQDARLDAPPSSVIGWRLPTVTYAWHLLFSDGGQIGTAFLILTLSIAILAFLVARELSNASFAIIPASLICGYYFYGASSIWLVFVEYWGLVFSFAAAYFFVSNRTAIAAGFAALAPLVRELYIITMVAGFIGDLASKNMKKVVMWIVAGLFFMAIYGLHYGKVKTMIPVVNTSASWLTGGGLKLVLDSMSFSTSYLAASTNTATIVYVLGLLGLFSVASLRNKVFLIFIAIIPPLIFNFIGNEWSYYWGVSFMPFVFLGFAPGLVAFEKIVSVILDKIGLEAWG